MVANRASEAIDLARLAGLELDPWQCLVLENMLAIRDEEYWDEINGCYENQWAASEFGLVVARQNGKGGILEARELAGLFLFGEKEIIHSAHLFDTSQKHFERVRRLIEDTPDLRSEVLQIKAGHGQEGIYLRSGQKLIFKARSGSAGRGFSAPLVVYDEAMMNLNSSVIEASMPTVSAQPNHQILYAGSAGTAEAEHFGRARNRAMKVIAKEDREIRFGWMEWSVELCTSYCPPDCEDHDDPNDSRTWAKANPALGIRISEEYIRETEKKAMSPAGFAKERLSVGDWPAEDGGWRVISKAAWDDRRNALSQLQGKFCLALDSSPDADYTCITAVGLNDDKQIHGEITGIEDLFDYRPGIKWAVERVVDIWKANKPAFVVVNPATPAGRLIPELESRGVKVETVTTREYAQGCGDFKDSIILKGSKDKGEFTHIDQTPLDIAVANANTRKLQELWAWDKTESSADITPLTAMTLAYYGYKKHIYSKPANIWFYRG